jgi:hypothetical protein
MIATLAEIKVLLGISDSSKDTQITALIPIVESDLFTYCNNLFLDQDITFGGSCTITSAGSAYKIVCAAGGMDAVGFASGDKILLKGSKRNDGYWTISGVASGYIQVAEAVVAESTAFDADLTLAVFPSALKIYVAKMIGYQLYHVNDSGLTGESIGNYSYSRQSGGSLDAGYPAEILKGLDRWRMMSMKKGTIQNMFRDFRGMTESLGDGFYNDGKRLEL